MKLLWAFLPVSMVACASGKVAGSDCAYPELPASDCSPWLPPAAVGRTWQLSFSEEFEGSGYDAAKLTPASIGITAAARAHSIRGENTTPLLRSGSAAERRTWWRNRRAPRSLPAPARTDHAPTCPVC